MRIAKILLIFFFCLICLPVSVCAGSDVSPLSISRQIRLNIPARHQFQVVPEWNEEKTQNKEKNIVVAEEEQKELDYKVTLSFSKGKFSQIKEQVYQGQKITSEEDLEMFPDDKKIVRNFKLIKENISNKTIVYTFFSI